MLQFAILELVKDIYIVPQIMLFVHQILVPLIFSELFNCNKAVKNAKMHTVAEIAVISIVCHTKHLSCINFIPCHFSG